jgi:hypothetical protein
VVVAAVVVQEADPLALGYGSDQQVREAHGPDMSSAPESFLDRESATPVFVVGGEPFVAEIPVRSQIA